MAQALSETELLRLADALADGEWHSGEDLAALAGVTRAALSKRVEKLRDWQLDIESRQGLGYRLSQPLERLDLQTLRESVRDLQVNLLAVTDSTNAQLLANDASADPQALFAEFQTAGRGRRGRQWVSPFGANLYLSLAWSFAQWPRQLTTLPLAVGVACARALRQCGLDDVKLKWPNDIYVGTRKLGGILIEHRAEVGGPCRVIIGIGINVAMSRQQAGEVEQPWISLNEALTTRVQKLVSRNALAAALLQDLQKVIVEFERSAFDSFASEWSALDLTLNHDVRILENNRELQGIARGVDEQGALQVEVLGELRSLHAGEVSLRLT
jgi:BirA family biotin operon repressor/biotin-[acetyl-CoA-carboxylase] ligase